MIRALLATLLLAWLFAPPARASGDGGVMPFALDPYGGPQAEQDAFYDGGKLGVLMGRSPWPRLFAGWRMMHGLPVGTAAGHGLALPCCDANNGDDITKDWLAARATVPGAPPVDYATLFRPVGDFGSIQTCFADAFATAARTLRDRASAYGAADPAVRAWLAGQDAVFTACHEDGDLPPLPADAPAWLAKDRAYQDAAHALYERRFDDAQTRFAAIAADAESPWQKYGSYLAARAAVDAALPSKDPAVIAQARDRLKALAPGTLGHDAAAALSGALDFRSDPDARRAVLIAELTGATLPATAAADLKDLRRLGQSPPGRPEFLDWLTVFGRAPDKPQAEWFEHYTVEQPWQTDADALAHAKERWAATKDPAWLIAAMQASAPGPDAAALVAAARALPATHPAWLTAAYHRIRLDPGNPAETARELDAILARTDLSITTRNLFMAQREMTVADQAGFVRFARRAPACAPVQYGVPLTPAACLGVQFGMDVYEGVAAEGRFGDDALATIDRLPLDLRTALSEDPALSAPLRLDVALTSWTRAALAGDDPAADRLARDLVALLPQAASDWTRFAATPPGSDKRFAAWFLLAKLPGASTHLSPGPSDYPNGEYTRPAGDQKAFEGRWPNWTYAPAGSPAVQPTLPNGDVVCAGLCGGGASIYRTPPYAAAWAERAARERGRYDPAANVPGTAHVWEELLTYVRAHPSDPRAPEALYWLVRVSRFGQGNARSSFRAFRLLKERYAATNWAKETRYFYD